MSLLTIAIVLIVAGFLLWVVNTYIPMAAPIKMLLNLLVVIVLVIWLLQVFGILGSLGSLHIK